MTRLSRRAALLLPLAATGCSWFEGLLDPAKAPLPDGKREAVSVARRGLAVDAADTRSVTVPPPRAVTEWLQPGAGPSHVVGNIAVSGLAPAWRSSIGEGGGYRDKITSQPVVASGATGSVVFTMDSDGLVAAFDLATGSRFWRTDTQAEDNRSTNVGGGVSFAAGVVYASTGRAEVLALDAATGAIRWRKPLGAPARSAPSIADGRLMVVTNDDRIQAFSAADGERQWSYQAAFAATTLFGDAAPAISDGIVVAGFGSGELVALRADSGSMAWSDSLASGRGRGSMADLSAVRALPVIEQGRVYAIGAGGLLVSLDLRSGRRLWEREFGGLQTPWIAGDWLFVQTLDQVLAAVNKEDGHVRWVRDLPRYERPDKRKGPLFWTGPILVDGKLLLAGSNETAVTVNPATGVILDTIELRGPAAVAPVAAAGTVLIVTDDGTLQAFR